ncbi:hypothetical protein L2E82_28223 [Cichorium intybus]|uniref:Uncharacterized protein n=1 Tax=Cichorium intybus TaxID=13427 RepID=A0ACB9CVF5_CICIN|nr:hypothetical protein L2E82_28223 [Cichorium intybus]
MYSSVLNFCVVTVKTVADNGFTEHAPKVLDEISHRKLDLTLPQPPLGADIQEVTRSAIALKILTIGFLPLWAGVLITAFDCNLSTTRQLSISGNNGELCSTTPESFPKESTITSNEAHSSSTHLSGRKSLNKEIHLPEAQCASPSKSSYGGYGDEKNGFVGTDELQQEEDFPEVKVDFQSGNDADLSCKQYKTSKCICLKKESKANDA